MSTGVLHKNLTHFASLLRSIGFGVGTDQTLLAAEALSTIDLSSRTQVYWALHTVFVRDAHLSPLFAQAFSAYWENALLQSSQSTAFSDERVLPSHAAQRLLKSLVTEAQTERPAEEERNAEGTASSLARIRAQDFETLSDEEREQALTALKDCPVQLPRHTSRRYQRDGRGTLIDTGASLRAAIRSPDLLPLIPKRPHTQPSRLTVLCDISGSMSAYVRLLLHFAHLLSQKSPSPVECFLFGTKLHHITRHLHTPDADAALSAIATHIEDWQGGTRIGEALHDFNTKWARRALSGVTTVILITDGLERDHLPRLEREIARLHRMSHHLIWLNPLLRYDGFEAKASGIRTLLPHVDAFKSIHSITSIEDLLRTLADASPAPGRAA